MRPTNYLPGPALVLSTLASLSIFAAPAMAQDNSSTDDSKSTPTEKATPTSSSKETPSSSKQSSSDKSSASSTKDSSSSSSSPSKTNVSITNTGTVVTTDATSVPSITGGPQATTGPESTGFPTLTRGGYIPEYPAPTVPPTKNAPFMHHSTMPAGTVFIAVGAILGAFGLAIILWRGIVSLLLHRSVKRAAMAQTTANSKAGFLAPPAPFYKYTDQGSTMSLGGGSAAAGRGVRRTTRGPIPSATPSHSNLFFSPTAPNNAPGARGSAFLPSGFYASGSSSPGPPNQTNSISLNNLRPDSRGHYTNASRHTLSQTPPDSPQYPARRDVSGMSTSSLNLSSLAPGQRAPSAYLEDLLADDPNAFPPPQMPSSVGSRNSANLGSRTASPQNRF